jgi:hypothetical protein
VGQAETRQRDGARRIAADDLTRFAQERRAIELLIPTTLPSQAISIPIFDCRLRFYSYNQFSVDE